MRCFDDYFNTWDDEMESFVAPIKILNFKEVADLMPERDKPKPTPLPKPPKPKRKRKCSLPSESR